MKILMVCLGNICRSPMAQGIMESKLKDFDLDDWHVDSAGTSGWHDGERPDQRAIKTSQINNVDISNQYSRKLTLDDLDEYDVIFAMDSSNYQDILGLCQKDYQKAKVHLLLNFKFPGRNMGVPDPYYDGTFGKVYDLLDEAMDDIIKRLIVM
ncbi:MAG: low molecular weight phosphotyrosine protein phosphatase [Saprospiraceae bacterium]|jgi:protein-tyrosine phosphatase|nr:low molecular weight phosphotyrosine protein phosphatase [Saprospiraceae bacterium]